MNNIEAHLILATYVDFSREELEESVELKVFELRNFLLSHPVALPLLSKKLKYLHKIILACDQLKLFSKKNIDGSVNEPIIFLQSVNFYDLYKQYLERLQVIKLAVSNSILPLQLNSSLCRLMDLQNEFERIHVALFQQNSETELFFNEKYNQYLSSVKVSAPIDHFSMKNSILEIATKKNIVPNFLDWKNITEEVRIKLALENTRIIKSKQLMQ